ncbi:MAG: YjfB family protein [Rubripirellula sp.]
MSSIPAPVRQVLQARSDATQQQINTAIVKKGLDTQKQTGDAINELLSQAVDVQRQLAKGHIDVKV